ncbi:16S rRNA (guanine1207-N2)-methyltransferase [Psychromicrobium silvestre]|uniref:16S rRNA (Guanine1207-N2)-methyltransferase n=1 Tax=Psychromicrobium silvestre TaxID=1645614 RepID=A0A7Y9S4M8_9MICC|nr:methyltransferase [Psychromicrobium silvestre]NYE94474.1 16S rRNA (guanine1207-N2)-methyltransferase [Psychromicrobium silvestre]
MANSTDFEIERLRRAPDIEAANLFAWDASDLLLLDEAADYQDLMGDDGVVVLGDAYGALSLGLAERYGVPRLRVYQDLSTGEEALRNNAHRFQREVRFDQLPLGEQLLSGARLILLQLPRSLVELEELVQNIALYAAPDAVLLAGGRIKHMTLAMNAVLGRYFSEVRAGLARQKSRLLTARVPLWPSDPLTFPQQRYLEELDLQLCAHGAVFSGTTLDIGTRFLLEQVTPDRLPTRGTGIDLGCGSGVIAATVARRSPELKVIATDRSAAAVASAAATAQANGISLETLRDDAAASLPAFCADVVLLNPPFHAGAAVHSGVALRLFDAAARLLKPGGQLWTVYNRHLSYRAALQRSVGSTELVAQNQKFVVTLSRSPGRE